MSRIEKLIEELCPEGVLHKPLKEIAKIERGVRVVKSQLSETEGFPVFQNSLTPLGYNNKANVPANSTFVIAAGAAGEVGYSKQEFWAADDCFHFNSNLLNNRFLYHVLLQNQQLLLSKVRKASIPRLARTALEQLIVPIPPQPVQEEIVRILDCFTELEAELEAELETRKKQYEHYRDTLLNSGKPTGCSRIDQLIEKLCPKGVSYKPLKEIAEIKRGVRVVKNQLSETKGFPVFQNSLTPLGYNKTANVPANSTFVIAAGAAGEIGYSIHKFWAADDCYYFNSELLNNRFLYHVLSRNQHLILSKVRKASIPRLARSVLEQVNIPLLPLRVQEEIVRILDRFDKLCNDLSVGLPAEIEARRKQYEYYRDKLLTFKELEA